jgi:hypothetical protein
MCIVAVVKYLIDEFNWIITLKCSDSDVLQLLLLDFWNMFIADIPKRTRRFGNCFLLHVLSPEDENVQFTKRRVSFGILEVDKVYKSGSIP